MAGPRLIWRDQGRHFMGQQIRQFLGVVTRPKDPATWLQGQPGFEVPCIDWVESERIDQLNHRSNCRAVIAGGRHANAAERAVWTPALLEFEIAEVVEALHHPRG